MGFCSSACSRFWFLSCRQRLRLRTPPPPQVLTIDVTDVSLNEGDAGETDMVFSVTLSDSPTHKVRVRFATTGLGRNGGTARGGAQAGDEQDFQAVRGRLLFEAGATGAALTKTVEVAVLGDQIVESDETFTLRVTNLATDDSRVVLAGGGASIAATGTITNDDQEVAHAVGADGDEDDEGDEDFSLQQASPEDQEEVLLQTSSSPSVVVSPTTITMSEGGGAVYTVGLAGVEPTGTVTITISRNTSGTYKDAATLTFSPGVGWDDPRPIRVWGLVDDENEGLSYTIRHTVSAAGTNYASVTADDVSVTISDTTATLTLATDPAAVTEGENINLTVTSDINLRGVVPVKLTLAARSSSTFTAADIRGALTQTYYADFGETGSKTGSVVIITNRDTADSEGAEAYSITLAEAKSNPNGRLTNNGYKLGTDVTANGTINDATSQSPSAPSGSKDVTVFPLALTIPEGQSALYSIKLDSAPTGGSNATVTVDWTATTGDDVGFTSGSLEFTTSNWSVPQYVRVWTLEDDDDVDDTVTFTHSISGGGYDSVSVRDVAITIDDNE